MESSNNKSPVLESIEKFYGKYYWFLYDMEVKSVKNNITYNTRITATTSIIENYHPFFVIDEFNKINCNFRYYLKNYKEITKEEFDLFNILNPTLLEENKENE